MCDIFRFNMCKITYRMMSCHNVMVFMFRITCRTYRFIFLNKHFGDFVRKKICHSLSLAKAC